MLSSLVFSVLLTAAVFYFATEIFSEVTDLQEKARKEGILKNDSDDVKRMSEDNNFLVRNF